MGTRRVSRIPRRTWMLWEQRTQGSINLGTRVLTLSPGSPCWGGSPQHIVGPPPVSAPISPFALPVGCRAQLSPSPFAAPHHLRTRPSSMFSIHLLHPEASSSILLALSQTPPGLQHPSKTQDPDLLLGCWCSPPLPMDIKPPGSPGWGPVLVVGTKVTHRRVAQGCAHHRASGTSRCWGDEGRD